MSGHPLFFRPVGKRNPAGFTLIELLVVIAVIGILAALLLPVLQKAQLKGQRIACLNNLRQMSIARHIYTDDHGAFILATADENSVDVAIDTGNPKVLICPTTSAPKTPISGGWGAADATYFGEGTAATAPSGSYAINGWLAVDHSPVDPDTQFFYRKEADLATPATTPLFLDSTWYYIFPLETDPTLHPSNLYTGYNGQRSVCEHSMGLGLIDRHNSRPAASAPRAYAYASGQVLPGMINMVFADNHAEVVRLNNLWSYPWHQEWATPRVHP